MWTKRDAIERPGCLNNAADHEPVFILRGQDITMPYMLLNWAELVEKLNGGQPTAKTIEARRFAKEVRDWQSNGHNRTKIPD